MMRYMLAVILLAACSMSPARSPQVIDLDSGRLKCPGRTSSASALIDALWEDVHEQMTAEFPDERFTKEDIDIALLTNDQKTLKLLFSPKQVLMDGWIVAELDVCDRRVVGVFPYVE